MIAYEYVFLIGLLCWVNGFFVSTFILSLKRSRVPNPKYNQLKDKYLNSALKERNFPNSYSYYKRLRR